MSQPLRQPTIVDLKAHESPTGRSSARGQNFLVERFAFRGAISHPISVRTEAMVLLPGSGARVAGDYSAELPGNAIAILPAGSYELEIVGPSEVYVLTSDQVDKSALDHAVNAQDYTVGDERVRPVGGGYRRKALHAGIRIYPVGDIAVPPDNGRLRFLQSETLSVNWVEYEGVRDRSALSPHAHSGAEQGSLAIVGEFVHHFRTPWGRDADLWQEDRHPSAGPATIAVIPPEIVHTTEGIGEGRHLLIDVFAPPRADFIGKGWVFNADEYLAPDGAGA